MTVDEVVAAVVNNPEAAAKATDLSAWDEVDIKRKVFAGPEDEEEDARVPDVVFLHRGDIVLMALAWGATGTALGLIGRLRTYRCSNIAVFVGRNLLPAEKTLFRHVGILVIDVRSFPTTKRSKGVKG